LAVTLKNLACLLKPVYEDLAPIVQGVSRPAEKVRTGNSRDEGIVMQLTADMGRLREEIAASHEARRAFVEKIAPETREMLARFRQAHAEMAIGLKAKLLAIREDLAGAHRAFFGPDLGFEKKSKRVGWAR
jgi:hypothetical protein